MWGRLQGAGIPYDSAEHLLHKELRDMTDYCLPQQEKVTHHYHCKWCQFAPYIMGEQRHCLMKYLVRANLNILYQHNEPTFVVHKRKEVTDLTLGTNKTGNLVASNWHACEVPSLANHSTYAST
jgi:hypothetical protein